MLLVRLFPCLVLYLKREVVLEVVLEDLTLHVVVVVQEVHSVARLVLVAGALNVDVDEVMVVQKPVDDIIAVVVEVRLLTAPF